MTPTPAIRAEPPQPPGASPRAGAPVRANNRLDLLLEAAAALFAERGFTDTTMRYIAARAHMLPGSIYYHFPSKEALLVAVYREGVERLIQRVERVDDGELCDPWVRLERIMIAHLESILDGSDFARVIIRVLPDAAPRVRDELVALRDAYEARILTVVGELPLAAGVDRRLFRLFLMGAANHTPVWRREGGLAPRDIAVQLVRTLRGSSADRGGGVR